jgi:hypothetical protein
MVTMMELYKIETRLACRTTPRNDAFPDRQATLTIADHTTQASSPYELQQDGKVPGVCK